MDVTGPDAIKKILERSQVIRKGHFVYASGRHGETYLEKRALLKNNRYPSQICEMIAQRAKSLRPRIVVGPESGGKILAEGVTRHLRPLIGKHITFVVAQKDADGGFFLDKSAAALVRDRPTLIVDDVVSTGGSLRKVYDVVKGYRADIVGLFVIINRGNVLATQIAPEMPFFEALVSISLDSYPPFDCPLCRSGVPIDTKLGHGKKFLAQQIKK